MLKELLFASLGTMGFGLLFNSKNNKLICIMIGGFLNYLGYYLTIKYTNNIFIASLVASVITFLYSNLSAILIKCPSTIFAITGLIPIVPGGSLFYTMENLVLGNTDIAYSYGVTTILTILGIACGSLIATTIEELFKHFNYKKTKI